jgi:sterol desaturase/sphingolipid hydroxylase (fatty acid hydroxylase superfamily)
MQELLTEISSRTSDTFFVLLAGYLLLLLSWPGFLLLERLKPVQPNTPRSNYWLNWRITLSNLFLAPVFAASVAILTIYLGSTVGLPSLELPTSEISVGMPVVDILLQGTLIFFTAAFLGDFGYYWWHRLQHTVPILWELHKLHHSDENLNSTTIYRSHFLEPAGQGLIRGLTIGLVFDTTLASQNIMVIVAGGALLGLWDFFIHANVRIDALHRLLPFFSNPQFHWIHHSKEPEHQDKNYSIWLPMFDIAFGSYYHPRVDEYPPTGLSTGEKIETVWEGQTGPFVAWARMFKNRRASQPKERPN